VDRGPPRAHPVDDVPPVREGQLAPLRPGDGEVARSRRRRRVRRCCGCFGGRRRRRRRGGVGVRVPNVPPVVLLDFLLTTPGGFAIAAILGAAHGSTSFSPAHSLSFVAAVSAGPAVRRDATQRANSAQQLKKKETRSRSGAGLLAPQQRKNRLAVAAASGSKRMPGWKTSQLARSRSQQGVVSNKQ